MRSEIQYLLNVLKCDFETFNDLFYPEFNTMLRRTCLLLIISALTILNVSAQDKNTETLAKIVSSTLLNQVLNDFERTTPLIIYTPGMFFLGNKPNSAVSYLRERDYYNNDKIIKASEFYHNEIFDAIDKNFIPSIPSDSIMIVRAFQDKQLLFEFKFEQKADTLIFTQNDALKSKTKTFRIIDGNVTAGSFIDINKKIFYNTQLIHDSLRITELNNGSTGRQDKQEITYQNGLPVKLTHYVMGKASYELESTDIYTYNTDQQPGFVQSVNNKGKITDSTHYFYDSGKLVYYQHFSGRDEELAVTLIYNRLGKLSDKTVKSPIRNYSINYFYSGGILADMEIDDKSKTISRHFVFKYNVNKSLVNLEYNTIQKESLLETLKTQWVFAYNNERNLSSVKVMDSNGLVIKEIGFEYDYYSISR